MYLYNSLIQNLLYSSTLLISGIIIVSTPSILILDVVRNLHLVGFTCSSVFFKAIVASPTLTVSMQIIVTFSNVVII